MAFVPVPASGTAIAGDLTPRARALSHSCAPVPSV